MAQTGTHPHLSLQQPITSFKPNKQKNDTHKSITTMDLYKTSNANKDNDRRERCIPRIFFYTKVCFKNLLYNELV
jgi:hypothetical protein